MEDRPMTVREAGRRGGLKRLEKIGPEGFAKMGKKGGRRLKELIELGKKAQEKEAEQQQR